MPDLFHTVRTCEDSLKDFITWKLGTLVSIVRQVDFEIFKMHPIFCTITVFFSLWPNYDVIEQHIRKYLQDLLSLVSEFWSAFSLPAPARPALGYPVSVAASLILVY